MPRSDMGFRDKLRNIFRSPAMFIVYIIVCVLCGILLLWTIATWGHPNSGIFVFLEFVVTIFFMLEIAGRVYVETPQAYFSLRSRNWFLNYMDVILCFLSLMSFFLYLLSQQNSVEESVDSIVDTVLILGRYGFQILRLGSFVKTQVLNRTSNAGYLDLNTHGNNPILDQSGSDNGSSSGLDEDDLFSKPEVDVVVEKTNDGTGSESEEDDAMFKSAISH